VGEPGPRRFASPATPPMEFDSAMSPLTQISMKLRDQLSKRFVGAIEPELWDRIRSIEAGQNEFGFDPFGFQPEFLKFVIPPAHWVYRNYFRVETFGIENIPAEGRVILVANHSGQIAFDAMMLGSACLFDLAPPRIVRSMVERWVPTIPFVSWFFARLGQVVGTRDNARALLRRDGCLLVFPEGVRGISKAYDRAYELEEFGLGFMRLALETNTAIVPIGVVGAEEQLPSVANLDTVAKTLGLPSLPLTPAMLLLGPLGGLPMPVKYRIHFGEPLHFKGKADDEDSTIRANVEEVRKAITSLLEHGLKTREGIFW
jgi:1-acyl-sn-glycerol-3-phosphate acyltransferase